MPNNPIQILLNAQNYVRLAEVTPGGSVKDFYEGRDAAFQEHKKVLQEQISGLRRDAAAALGADSVFFAKVDLQSRAWAKSHRPYQKVFPPAVIRSVAGSELGSIVVEVDDSDLRRIEATVQLAENAVTEVDKHGKLKPSRVRSEVGAIKSLRLYGPSDRRKFSAAQAVRWLSDPRTGGTYYIETFVSDEDKDGQPGTRLRARAHEMLATFEGTLRETTLPIKWSRVNRDWLPCTLYMVKVNDDVQNEQEKLDVHSELLKLLERLPIVKSIILPPVLQAADLEEGKGPRIPLPAPDPQMSYPVIGIVDTGVAQIDDLQAWSAGRSDFLDGTAQDVSHGSFIAGLVSVGSHFNTGRPFQEMPCRFFDMGLHPTGNYENFYPNGFLDFLDQLDVELAEARALDVRVFNMSLAVTMPVIDDSYSVFAGSLDLIADKHDALFVLPAGNLDANHVRDPWPGEPTEALAMLARYPHQDRIYQPADSIRAVVVGALDPAMADGTFFPARYSRRGPGPSLGAKPDVAHIGGRFDAESGLVSVTPDGRLVQSCGTSYAAPLVAKTLATLDHAIEGTVTRETLIALLVHHAKVPAGIGATALKAIARDFVGAGIPAIAEDTLLVGDNAITLVFSGILAAGQELQFGFSWPSSLVNEKGGCAGSVKLTWAYRPPVDRGHGGEFVRANLDAYLRQEEIDEDGEVSFKGRLKEDGKRTLEKDLIANGAKWWPVKTAVGSFTSIGRSSQWRLVIDSLCRAAFMFPDNGIPFCAVLTISDSKNDKPIFNEMRAQLQRNGVELADIRSAVSGRVRS